MFREKIYQDRIRKFLLGLNKTRFRRVSSLEAEYIVDTRSIPYQEALKAKYKKIEVGDKWGKSWDSAWFRFRGRFPVTTSEDEHGAFIDLGGEGCVWKNGHPWQGLTSKVQWANCSGKYYIPLVEETKESDQFELLVESSANGLFGSNNEGFYLKKAELVQFNKRLFQLEMDVNLLIDLALALVVNTPRRNKILSGLNKICNIWQDGQGLNEALEISKSLLAKKANASSLTAYSIGHAHLDLAWLWPIVETRRKAGRTFATALRLIEEYEDYKFGASQPQLYQWIKQDYPDLYQEMKKAVNQGRWECQGAMWVESDTNLPSGESLIRQCFYGKRFFRQEFGKDVQHLWLPDVFGYSAALPQILKKSGVNVFMTQKLSWNETNDFPHHTFYWQGIDGTRILTHFLPTNDYNLANLPSQLIAAETRYTQNDVTDEFLNLYGIGDGGGGPGREHIELGLRQKNLEGTPRFKFSFAQEFFDKIKTYREYKIPIWSGELYLELHRGTYTTQGLSKKNNRLLEQKLHDVEFLGSLVAEHYPKAEIDQIWQNTLMNQFHDILPGSAITRVYDDANALSEKNITRLKRIKNNLLTKLHGQISQDSSNLLIYNTQPWERTETIHVSQLGDLEVTIPGMGYRSFRMDNKFKASLPKSKLKVESKLLENDFIRIRIGKRGEICSIHDKEIDREVLTGAANNLQLWEDLPNNWGAWDINHFYRETKPQQAILMSSQILDNNPFKASIKQNLKIGSSTVEQIISIYRSSRLIKIWNRVDWKEKHKMLRVCSEPDLVSSEVSCEIQFGLVKRSTIRNTSWEKAKFEVPAHRFVDLSETDYGFAIFNDCKYGHFLDDKVLDLCLLRSPMDTDPKADMHIHEFSFAYYPHTGNLENSDTLQEAHDFNNPLLIVPVKNISGNSQHSFYIVKSKEVKLSVVKPAADRDGVILRFYEPYGNKAAVDFQSNLKWDLINRVNLIEENLEQKQNFSGQIRLNFKPFEIKSYRLSKKNIELDKNKRKKYLT